MSRRGWVLALVAAAVMAAGLTVAGPAQADGLDDLCKSVPAPARPDYQVSGLVMDKPDLAKVPSAAPDPFKDPTVPISDVYGWAWRFTNYDLGCGNDFIRDPNAVATTASANFVMAWMATLTSWVASLENMAHTGVFDWMQGVVTNVADILRERVLTVWLPLSAVLLSIVVVFTSSRAGYAETMRRIGMLVGSIALAAVTLVLPRQAMALADEAIDSAAGVAQAGFSTQAADLVTREAIYKTWLVGNFGSADSAIAQEYGPRLMSALTYTWSDVKRMESDPSAKAKIDQAKAAEFKAIAGEVEKKDPTAYASLTGKTDTRTAPATLGVVWVILMGLFVAIASFIVVLAKLAMLGLILYGMVAPVLGVLKFSVLQRVWDLFTAAVLNVVKFVVAAGLMTLVLSALSTAPVGVGWRMMLAIIATVFALMLTRPVRSFKAMAGMDPSKSFLGSMLRRALGTAAGAVIGAKIWESKKRKEKTSEEEVADDTGAAQGDDGAVSQPVEPSYPPLPAPRPLLALPAGTSGREASEARTAGWAGYSAVDGRRPRSELPAGTGQRAELPAGAGRQAELPAGASGELRALPVGTIARPVRALAVAGALAAAGSRPAGADEPWAAAGSAEGNPGSAEPPSATPRLPTGPGVTTSSRESTPAPPVVYPTGIILSPDPSLYRSSSSDAAATTGEYVRFNEPQVDQDGQETWEPIYRAAAKAG